MFNGLPGVSIGSVPRRDGRYQGYILDQNNKRVFFYGKTYRELGEKMKRAIRNGVLEGKEEKQHTPNFKLYVEKWIETYKKPNLKPTSLRSLIGSLKYAFEAFCDKEIGDIKPEEVQELLTGIESSRVRDLCKLNLSQVFKKAVAQGLIDRNPCETVEIKKYKNKHRNAMTVEEQERFLAAIKGNKHELLYRLLLSTGLRIGEALALRHSDIDFKNCTLTVNKNVVFTDGKRIEQDTPKTEAGNRTLPVPKEICDKLLLLGEDLLFPYTYNAIHCSIQRIAKEIGVEVTPHILRHTYATRLEEAGIPPKVKQYLMGHASLDMTQNVYTDAQKQYVESVSDQIRNIF